jgi:uncharacterized RDD family membrane protein YckC
MSNIASNPLNHTSMAHSVAFDQSHSFDELSVGTPEQVDLRFPVAGLGSRFLAILTDHLIQIATVLLLSLLAYVTGAGKHGIEAIDRSSSLAQNWWVAGITLFFFLLFWGYFSLFEAFWNGQTPGKRLLKIRVIKDSGRSITLFEALARNLLRVADYFPSLYLAGVITMLCNRSQKRLGDLVAGTIVVHERTEEQPLLTHTSRTFTANIYPEAPAADRFAPRLRDTATAGDGGVPADAIARLGPDDLHLIETFFSRALDLTVEKRAELAARMATTVCGRMGAPRPEGMDSERLLELVAFRMRGQRRF